MFMLEKIMAGVLTLLCIAALAAFTLVCYFIWPEKDSTMPAWIQAIGAAVAIIGAGGGIWLQLRSKREDDHTESANMISALAAEVDIYRVAVSSIKVLIESDLDALINERLRFVFPQTRPRFPVYTAIAGRIGVLKDAELRTSVVAMYADLDVLFTVLNSNSGLASDIPHSGVPDGDLARKLAALFPLIVERVDSLAQRTVAIKAGLDHAVSADEII
jgi:hypothetical protein